MRWFRTESGLVARQLGREDLRVVDYDEGQWNPGPVSAVKLNGVALYTNPRWIRIGNLVTAFIESITGLSVTASGTDVHLQFTSEGLPGYNNNTTPSGTGLHQRASELHSVEFTNSSGGNTNIFMGTQANSAGASTFSGIVFSYIYEEV